MSGVTTSALLRSEVQDAERLSSRVALPLTVLLLGYPLWWMLGLQAPVWPVAALPLLAWLVANRRGVLIPPGYGVWLVFLCWVLGSALLLTSFKYVAAYGYRLAMYTAVIVIGFFVYNVLLRGVSPRTFITPLVVVWAAAVLLSFPGIIFGALSFTSPFELVLPGALQNEPFINALVHPSFASYDELYDVARPSPLFAYTNEWGAGVGILTPVAIYVLTTTRRAGVKVLIGLTLALSLIPIIYSINRGCWISIGVALAFVLVRRGLAGDAKSFVAGLAGATVLLLAVVVTPLYDVVQERLDNANTSTRETLYAASIELAKDSPLFGYGSPVSSEGLNDTNDVSIGTHGQIWTVLVSQGFVGCALFFAALVVMILRSSPGSGRSPKVWLQATGPVVIVQGLVYTTIPIPLATAAICLAVCAAGASRRIIGAGPAREGKLL